MLYMHQPANVIPMGPLTLEFTPQLTSLPYLPQIKGAFCYGIGEPEFAIEEYAMHAPPRNDTLFLVANGDLELDNIDGGPVVVEDAFNTRDAYLILQDMDHISIVDDALRANPLAGSGAAAPAGAPAAAPAAGPAPEPAPTAAVAAWPAAAEPAAASAAASAVRTAGRAGEERAMARRSTRSREEQVRIVSGLARAALRAMVCPAWEPAQPVAMPEYVIDAFGSSHDALELWLAWLERP